MITSNVNNTSTTLAMPEDPSDDIGVGLFPSPLVLLDSPYIENISHKVECFAGIMLKEVVEPIRLTISSA